MRITLLLCFVSLIATAQKRDTVIYNYIYRDTVIYVQKEEGGRIDLSNWGIGPYVGVDYSHYRNYGGSLGYTLGFGVSYYIWRLPSFKRKQSAR